MSYVCFVKYEIFYKNKMNMKIWKYIWNIAKYINSVRKKLLGANYGSPIWLS